MDISTCLIPYTAVEDLSDSYLPADTELTLRLEDFPPLLPRSPELRPFVGVGLYKPQKTTNADTSQRDFHQSPKEN